MFDTFPENSQVWIYASTRFFTYEEEMFIANNLNHFISQWATHGTGLFAEGKILHHSFIVIVADENKVKSSGCSIDSSVRFIKDLGRELNIDFFNRMSILLKKEEEFKRIHFSDLSAHLDYEMFNPMVK
ncbi:MAG: hypothetical protein RI883_1965, partial [Bacteroidota bacterium]